jgi:hypothetical protein
MMRNSAAVKPADNSIAVDRIVNQFFFFSAWSTDVMRRALFLFILLTLRNPVNPV